MTVTDMSSPLAATTTATLPVLSVDELRVLLLLADATELPLASDTEDTRSTDVADAVAARSLLARGLAHLVREQLRIAPGARAALTPVTPADRIVQVELEASGALHRHVFAEGNGRALHLREREPDVWVVDPVACGSMSKTVVDLVTSHAAGSSGDTVATKIDIDAHTHLQSDAAAVDGTTADVVQLLLVAGVEVGAAKRWAAALTRRDGAGVVRVANRAAGLGCDPALTGQGIGWVAAGSDGLWRVVEHDRGASIMTSDLATLRSDVRAALAGEARSLA
jgi:hypothetical protein